MKQDAYKVITQDWAVAAARAFANLAPTGTKFKFCYVSGSGAHWKGAWTMFGRIKVRLTTSTSTCLETRWSLTDVHGH